MMNNHILRKDMIILKTDHILRIATKIIYVDGQCHKCLL